MTHPAEPDDLPRRRLHGAWLLLPIVTVTLTISLVILLRFPETARQACPRRVFPIDYPSCFPLHMVLLSYYVIFIAMILVNNFTRFLYYPTKIRFMMLYVPLVVSFMNYMVFEIEAVRIASIVATTGLSGVLVLRLFRSGIERIKERVVPRDRELEMSVSLCGLLILTYFVGILLA